MTCEKYSSAQNADVGALGRATYLWRVVLMNVARFLKPADFSNIAADLEFYRDVVKREVGRDLKDARILEIGHGQRPFRLILLQSLGCDVRGIDTDRVLYRIGVHELVETFKANGILRAIKSLIRAAVFDRSEYGKFSKFIRSHYGRPLSFDSSSMFVGSAADDRTWASAGGGKFDLIYSEDVFEHISEVALPSVIDLMADHLSDNGIAIVTPMIFTGISGGHVVGWFPHKVDLTNVRRGPAWGHLTGEAELPDTFLNKVSRKTFRALFMKRFDILQEDRPLGDIGRGHLTPERRRVLRDFDEDELFSNNVRFVLRKRS